LAGGIFQVLRRTHAKSGHDAGSIRKWQPTSAATVIGVAIDVYTKAALSRRAEAAETARKRRPHRLTE